MNTMSLCDGEGSLPHQSVRPLVKPCMIYILWCDMFSKPCDCAVFELICLRISSIHSKRDNYDSEQFAHAVTEIMLCIIARHSNMWMSTVHTRGCESLETAREWNELHMIKCIISCLTCVCIQTSECGIISFLVTFAVSRTNLKWIRWIRLGWIKSVIRLDANQL